MVQVGPVWNSSPCGADLLSLSAGIPPQPCHQLPVYHCPTTWDQPQFGLSSDSRLVWWGHVCLLTRALGGQGLSPGAISVTTCFLWVSANRSSLPGLPAQICCWLLGSAGGCLFTCEMNSDFVIRHIP